MEVSDLDVGLDGPELIETLVTLTGLPENWAQGELVQMIESSGQDSSDVTLADLRKILASYLEELHRDMEEKAMTES